MAITGNNSDFIKKEDLDNLKQLDGLLVASAVSMEKLLQEAQKVTTELGKAGTSYKSLSDAMGKAHDLEQRIIELEQRHAKILEDYDKLQQKVIKTTSEETKAIENERKAHQENTKAVEESNNAVTQSASVMDIARKAYDEAGKSIDGQRVQLVKHQNALKSTQAAIQTLDNLYKNKAISEQDYAKQKAKLIDAEQNQKIVVKELSDTIKYNNTILSTAIGSYNNLSAIYSRDKIQVNNMTDAEYKNGLSKKEMAENARVLYQEMSNLQKLTGKHTLDVGNYSKAYSGLGFQIQQVARELPALTNGAQMFFLAISNNLPMLGDSIKRARLEYDALIASGQKATPVWKQILGSILSWQTALVVGITILSVYGKEIVNFFKNIGSGSTAIDENKKAIERNNKVVDESSKSIADNIVKYKSLQAQWIALSNDLNTRKKFLLDHKTELDNTGIAIKNVTDAENVFVRNTGTVLTAIKLRAEAQVLEKLAAEELEKAIKNENTAWQRYTDYNFTDQLSSVGENFKILFENVLTGSSRSYTTALDFSKQASTVMLSDAKDSRKESDRLLDQSLAKNKQIADSLKKIGLSESGNNSSNNQISVVQKAIEALKRQKEEEATALKEIEETNYKTQADVQKRIIENAQTSYEERMRYANEFENKMGESINSRADKQISDLQARYRRLSDTAKKGGKAIGTFEEEFGNQIKLINQKREQELSNIDSEGQKFRQDILKDHVKKQIKEYQDLSDTISKSINEGESSALLELSKLYSKGEIDSDEYEKRKTDITINYAKDRLDAEIDFLRQLSQIAGLTDEQKADFEKKILDKELEYYKFINQQKTKSEDDEGKKREKIEKKLSEVKKQLWSEGIEFLKTTLDAADERETKRLDKQSEENEKWKEKEIARIDEQEQAGAISKEQADAQKAVIDQQAKLREEQLDQKRKEIALRQAKREKALALAKIAIDTAAAIIGVWKNPGFPLAIPLAIAVGALGAIQAATVLAQPLPAYKEGTKDHRGGLAWVGDGNRSELIVTPGGKMFQTPSSATLVDLPKHSVVYPDYEKAISSMAMTHLNKMDSGITVFEGLKQVRAIENFENSMKKMSKQQLRGLEAIQSSILESNSSKILNNNLNRYRS